MSNRTVNTDDPRRIRQALSSLTAKTAEFQINDTATEARSHTILNDASNTLDSLSQNLRALVDVLKEKGIIS